MNYESIPKEMYYGGISVDNNELHEVFADYFSSKITDLAANAVVDQAVYNGLKKIDSSQLNFMTELNIRRVMSTIKIKNCEGWDRIPQRIFVEGIEVLGVPLTNLFKHSIK